MKQHFSTTAYCFTYCFVILIGKLIFFNRSFAFFFLTEKKKRKGFTIGGWIGGLFEFLESNYNGCLNEHLGSLQCFHRYASSNVTVRCLNTFYQKSSSNSLTYICLCRFRKNLTSKYRDCDFLHAKINQ